MKANKLIGRDKEQVELQKAIDSDRAELIAVYGRRRIGKTFLVRQYFRDEFDFYFTGIYEATKRETLGRFSQELNRNSSVYYPPVEDWFEAFEQLRQYLSTIKKEKVVVFLDELPWMDTPRSRFIKAFDYFWNSWASAQDNIKLIVCGSATTWMTKELIGAKGGLHNRVTRHINVKAFTLYETEQYLKSIGVVWNRQQILESYMIMGGTPYYLSMIDKSMSLNQNIDQLFFGQNAQLRSEYDFLFKSLFKNSMIYRRVVEILATKSRGMTRGELMKELGQTDGGALTEVLSNLKSCDFLRSYAAFGKRERDVMYQLTDMYTLFYLQFVKSYNGQDLHKWSNLADTPVRHAWSGYAFEQVCLHHIEQIKKSLGILGVRGDVCSWLLPQKGQIDLIIDRNDQVINLCEMKYSSTEYEITAKYEEVLQRRRELFRQETRTKKALHLTMVTTYGIVKNAHSGNVQSEVTMEGLFER
ncbi:MAG: ATP-binding protein [Bacteroidia bacterium]|nr:ATP-binding protein [Bacteroidia bacterium]